MGVGDHGSTYTRKTTQKSGPSDITCINSWLLRRTAATKAKDIINAETTLEWNKK